MTNAIIVTAGTVLALLRIFGITSQLFQAVAHIFVGGLFGSYFQSKDKTHLWTAVIISLVELAVFLIHKFSS